MNVPESVESIERKAFCDCEALIQIQLPKGLVRIASEAFSYCISLQDITIPESVSQIGSDAFRGCKSLPCCFRIYNYTTRYGKIFNYDDVDTPVFDGVNDGEIYNSLKDFRVIEEDRHFYLGNSDNPYLVFCGHRDGDERNRCNITINPRTKAIDVFYVPRFPKAHCILEFYPIDELTWLSENFKILSADLKEKCVKSFADRYYKGEEIEAAVVDCYKKHILSQRKKLYPGLHQNPVLLNFMLCNGMIEKAACSKIFEEVSKTNNTETIAAMLDYMEKNGISAAKTDDSKELSLEGITLSPEEAKLDWAYSSVELDNGMKGLAIDSYKGTDSVVTIPTRIGKKPVIYISSMAFSPDRERLTSSARLARRGVKEVIIPEGVVGIEYYAFRGCNIEKISFPSTLEEIERGAFAGCEKLSEIKIPEHCSFSGSFVGCKMLENSNKMVVIGDKLDSCSSAKKASIQIPKSVTHVCAYAFYECTALKELVLHKNVKWMSKSLGQYGKKYTIIAPAGSYGIEYAKENGLSFKEI
jgi:hypothetical protein